MFRCVCLPVSFMNRQPSVSSRKLRNLCAKFTNKKSKQRRKKKSHITFCLYLFTLYNTWIKITNSCKVASVHQCFDYCRVTPALQQMSWRLAFGQVPCVPVILFFPPRDPPITEGLRRVFYSLLVCLLRDQDGLKLVSASFSISCLVTYEDRPGVPVCIAFMLHCRLIMLHCRLHYIF